MRIPVIVFNASHYDMGENRGLSVCLLGDSIQTNFKFGRDISEAEIPDYKELRYLQQFEPNQFPAKFNADISLTTIKASNGKGKTGVALKNLEFVNSVEFVDKVAAK